MERHNEIPIPIELRRKRANRRHHKREKTFVIGEEIEQRLKARDDINWSAVVRKLLTEFLESIGA